VIALKKMTMMTTHGMHAAGDRYECRCCQGQTPFMHKVRGLVTMLMGTVGIAYGTGSVSLQVAFVLIGLGFLLSGFTKLIE
jgi:hypothetical protein